MGEGFQAFGFQRPGHPDLVDGEAGVACEAHGGEGVQDVLVRLADGDDAEGGVLGALGEPVEAIGAPPGAGGRKSLVQHAAFEDEALGGPFQRGVDVEAVRRDGDVRGDEVPCGGDDDGGRLLGGFGDGLHRDPQAAEAGQRDSGKPELDDFGRVGRLQDRHHDGFEDLVGLVREGGRVGGVVVAGDGQHAAVAMAAEGVGDPQRVGGAVDAGSLAVPHTEHAIDVGAGVEVELLGAGQHGDGQVFVQARLESDVVGVQQGGAAP